MGSQQFDPYQHQPKPNVLSNSFLDRFQRQAMSAVGLLQIPSRLLLMPEHLYQLRVVEHNEEHYGTGWDK